jgi:hypothetical protein
VILAYADDIHIIGCSQTVLEEAFTKLEKVVTEMHLSINTIMHINKDCRYNPPTRKLDYINLKQFTVIVTWTERLIVKVI